MHCSAAQIIFPASFAGLGDLYKDAMMATSAQACYLMSFSNTKFG